MFAAKFNPQCSMLIPWNKYSVIQILFKICTMKILICIHIIKFSLVQKGVVQWQRERETGGWAQFDWMLDSFKAHPIANRCLAINIFILLLHTCLKKYLIKNTINWTNASVGKHHMFYMYFIYFIIKGSNVYFLF